jgi:hypothetical protein
MAGYGFDVCEFGHRQAEKGIGTGRLEEDAEGFDAAGQLELFGFDGDGVEDGRLGVSADTQVEGAAPIGFRELPEAEVGLMGV